MTNLDMLSAVEPAAEMGALERNLLEAGNELSRVLRWCRRVGVEQEAYAELVEWAGHLRISRGLSPNTAGKYVESLGQFLLWLKDRDIEDEAVTPGLIETWQQHLYLQHRQGVKTRGRKLVALRRFYAWRELFGKGPNPARSVQGPRKQERLPRKYTPAQLRRLFDACDRTTVTGRRDYAALLFILSTGARRMEVVGLEMHRLRLRPRTGVVRFMGKGAKERIVTFEGPGVNALREWLEDRDQLEIVDHEAVFVSLRKPWTGRGLTKSGVDNLFRRVVRTSGLELEPGMALHTLRSTYATALYDEGYDIEQIRILLGHDSIETTRQYIAISSRQLKARLSGKFLAEVTGEHTHELPLWARNQLERRR